MNFLKKIRILSSVSLFFVAQGPAIAAPCKYTGVNISGAEWGPAQPHDPAAQNFYPSQTQTNYYKGKGMNTLRVPFRWERLQPTLNFPFNRIEFSHLDASVSYATAKGLYVVLDPHNCARYSKNLIGSKEVPFAAFTDLWTRLAKAYGNNNRVIFGLTNEPHDMPDATLIEGEQAAINAIRATGARNLILVPGNNWTGAYSWCGWSTNSKIMLAITDPGNNFAFEVHQYVDSDSTGTKADITKNDPTIGVQRLTAFTNWCKTNHRRGFLGEFAVANSTISGTGIGTATISNMLTYIESNQDVWLGWTWWAGGARWGNYLFTIEPVRTGSGAYTDQPAMGVLANFLPGPTPTLSLPVSKVVTGSSKL